MPETQAALTFPTTPSTGSVLLTGPIHPQSCPISLPPTLKGPSFLLQLLCLKPWSLSSLGPV